jgi:hypothetical protein
VDSDDQVSLNISLRYIFKASYARHASCTNVSGKHFSNMKLILVLISIALWGCPGKKSESIATTMDSLENESVYFALPLGMSLDQFKAMHKVENYLAETDETTGEYIEFDCAVVVYPTSEEISKLRTILKTDDESIEVNRKLSESAASMIRSYGLKTVNTTGPYITFKGEKGVWTLDMRKDSLPSWKFILFKTSKDPTVLPNVLVTRDEVLTYFELSKNASR